MTSAATWHLSGLSQLSLIPVSPLTIANFTCSPRVPKSIHTSFTLGTWPVHTSLRRWRPWVLHSFISTSPVLSIFALPSPCLSQALKSFPSSLQKYSPLNWPWNLELELLDSHLHLLLTWVKYLIFLCRVSSLQNMAHQITSLRWLWGRLNSILLHVSSPRLEQMLALILPSLSCISVYFSLLTSFPWPANRLPFPLPSAPAHLSPEFHRSSKK